jgi:hypothetical protein
MWVRIVLGVVVLALLAKGYETYWEYRKGRGEGENGP